MLLHRSDLNISEIVFGSQTSRKWRWKKKISMIQQEQSEIYRNKNYVRVPHLVGYGDDSGWAKYGILPEQILKPELQQIQPYYRRSVYYPQSFLKINIEIAAYHSMSINFVLLISYPTERTAPATIALGCVAGAGRASVGTAVDASASNVFRLRTPTLHVCTL